MIQPSCRAETFRDCLRNPTNSPAAGPKPSYFHRFRCKKALRDALTRCGTLSQNGYGAQRCARVKRLLIAFSGAIFKKRGQHLATSIFSWRRATPIASSSYSYGRGSALRPCTVGSEALWWLSHLPLDPQPVSIAGCQPKCHAAAANPELHKLVSAPDRHRTKFRP